MPELPEVETIRRQLVPVLAGQQLTHVATDGSAHFSGATRAEGKRVDAVDRLGKYLLLRLESNEDLVLHLGMTGQLLLGPAVNHVRMTVDVRGVQLTLRDPRGFGRAVVVPRGEYTTMPTLASLGPDILTDWDRMRFARSLAAATGELKVLLLGQRLAAGVGNYLADETCFAARQHPRRRSLSVRQAARVGDALHEIVNASLEAGGVSERDYVHLDGGRGGFAAHLQVYGRAGMPCLRCGALLAKDVVAGRGTTWCPRCQRL